MSIAQQIALSAEQVANLLNETLGKILEEDVARLTPVQRLDYETLVAAGTPMIEALILATKPGRWVITKRSGDEA